MLKAMLVDDDVPMLKYLAKLVPWRELGLEIVAQAPSAKRALQQFRETAPDLIVTDIGMPGMDGLELAQACKKLNPEVRLIFLTCHGEFHYARTAVKLEAVDYLLKDELTAEQLRDSLKKAVQLLKEEKESRKELAYKQDLFKNREVLKQPFFQKLMSGSADAGMLDYGQRLGIDWKHPQFMMAIGTIRYLSFTGRFRYTDTDLLLYAISNISGELPLASMTVTTFIDPNAGFVCVANYQPSLTLKGMESFERYLRTLADKIKEYLGIDVYLTYGSPVKDLASLRQQYKKLKEWRRSSYYDGPAFGPMPSYDGQPWTSDVWNAVSAEWEQLRKAFKEHDEQSAESLLDQIKQKAANLRLEPEEWKLRSSQWIRVLELDDNRNGDNAFHECLVKTVRLEDTMHLVRTKIGELFATKTPPVDRKPKIQQIERYLSEHLSENLSLVDVAHHLYLNPSYLSRYFKLETGMNFTDFLHRFKMKLACQMLKGKQENIETISLKLGYADRTYFSKIFKKYVGVSPKDYR